MLADKCIEIHKKNNRFRFVNRDDLKQFLESEFNEKIKSKTRKPNMEILAYQHLSEKTIDLFTKKLKNFGITRADIAEVLDVSQYRATKLTQNGEITKIGEFYDGNSRPRIPFYIYSIPDVLSVKISDKDKKNSPSIHFEETNENLAEALYIINKSAKVSRDTKSEMYERGNHRICHAAKTRSNNLYDLKDMVIHKLITENRINLIGYHRSGLGYLALYELSGFTFHIPCNNRDTDAEFLGDFDEIVSAEKTRKTSINYYQAISLLKNYVAKVS